ncbi:MAG: DUF4097 family beta strand repeat-containing protein [Candidatus Limnocylindrales bacterium]
MSASAESLERVSGIEHEIGARGELLVRVPEGDVAIRGVEGDVARARDVGNREPQLRATRSVGRLEIAVGDWPGGGTGPRWLGFGRPPRVRLEVEVPHAARVQVEVASADVRALALDGEQHYRAVSGELELVEAGGAITVEGVSSDVAITARAEVALRVRTVSGDVRLRGPAVRELEIHTMSGDVRVEAPLLAGTHRVETVSGDAVLVGVDGLTVEASTISGDLATDLPHRISGGPGRRTMVVGDGAAKLAFRSMSGDLDLVHGQPQGGLPGLPAAPRLPVAPPAPPPPGRPGRAAPPTPAPPSAAAVADPREGGRLRILQELERGEIDVDEAGRRLAKLEEEVSDD